MESLTASPQAVANTCERLRTVANGCERLRPQTQNLANTASPPDPQVKREPSLRIREKGNRRTNFISKKKKNTHTHMFTKNGGQKSWTTKNHVRKTIKKHQTKTSKVNLKKNQQKINKSQLKVNEKSTKNHSKIVSGCSYLSASVRLGGLGDLPSLDVTGSGGFSNRVVMSKDLSMTHVFYGFELIISHQNHRKELFRLYNNGFYGF